MIELSIIIVTWNSREFIGKCIRSIKDNTSVSYEIIIIDNNSNDGTAELVEREFPDCRLVKPGANLGFSKANNIGIDQAKGRDILLLNPDTMVKYGAIECMIESLRQDDRIGIVGSKVLNPDGTVQLCSPRRVPSLFTEFLEITELNRFFPRGRLTGRYRYGNWGHDNSREVEVISGCSMLIRGEVLKQIIGLDEEFFFGGEDIHFCWKAKRAGWKILFEPKAQIIHFLSKSLEKTPDGMKKTDLESMYRLFYKIKGFGYALTYKLLVIVLNLGWLILEAIRYLFSEDKKREVFRKEIFPKYLLAINWTVRRRRDANFIRERYWSEQQHFNKTYLRVMRSSRGLVIPAPEIERYLNPDSEPLYGRVFSFYLLGDVSGKKVLDYGCGDGDNAVFLARKGALVTAIDCSQEAIRLTKMKAEANGVGGMVEALEMNAEKTSFADEEFDCIIGNAILHHLNLDRAKSEIYRVLKKGGVAIFKEPVIFDRVLGIVRKMIPYRHPDVTSDERPLNRADIKSFEEKFAEIEWWPFEAFSRIQFMFKNKHILKFLFKTDYSLFKTFLFMKRFASCAVIRCIK